MIDVARLTTKRIAIIQRERRQRTPAPHTGDGAATCVARENKAARELHGWIVHSYDLSLLFWLATQYVVAQYGLFKVIVRSGYPPPQTSVHSSPLTGTRRGVP